MYRNVKDIASKGEDGDHIQMKEKMGKMSDTEKGKTIGTLVCYKYLRCRHFEFETGSVGSRKRRHEKEAPKSFNVAS